MRNKTKGIIAGAAGVALLLGGSTFALWSDSATQAGGTITAGNLDIAALQPVRWWDISPDRVSSPHAIDNLGTWRIVPGDTIAGVGGLDIGLEGDNLVAQLVVATETPTGGLLDPAEGVTLTYSVYAGDLADPAAIAAATPLPGAANLALGTPTNLRFQADNVGQEAGANDVGIPVITSVAVNNVADVTVVVRARFAPETPNRVRVQTTAALGTLSFALNQVRGPAAVGGDGFNGTAP